MIEVYPSRSPSATENLQDDCDLCFDTPLATIFTAGQGQLTKEISILEDGAGGYTIGSDPTQAKGRSGFLNTPKFVKNSPARSMSELYEDLWWWPTSGQSICTGILPTDDEYKVVVGGKETVRPGVSVEKADKYFAWTPGSVGLVCIDFDTKDLTQEGREIVKSHGGLQGTLLAACPILARTAFIYRTSTSTGLYSQELDQKFDRFGGCHIYILVSDVSQTKNINLAIQARLEAMGVIGLIDMKVCNPSRHFYECSPILLDKRLSQEDRITTLHRGAKLDVNAFLEVYPPLKTKTNKPVKTRVPKDSAAAKTVTPKKEKKAAEYIDADGVILEYPELNRDHPAVKAMSREDAEKLAKKRIAFLDAVSHNFKNENGCIKEGFRDTFAWINMTCASWFVRSEVQFDVYLINLYNKHYAKDGKDEISLAELQGYCGKVRKEFSSNDIKPLTNEKIYEYFGLKEEQIDPHRHLLAMGMDRKEGNVNMKLPRNWLGKDTITFHNRNTLHMGIGGKLTTEVARVASIEVREKVKSFKGILTVRQIAEQLRIPKSTVSLYMNETLPKFRSVEQIIDGLKLEAGYIPAQVPVQVDAQISVAQDDLTQPSPLLSKVPYVYIKHPPLSLLHNRDGEELVEIETIEAKISKGNAREGLDASAMDLGNFSVAPAVPNERQANILAARLDMLNKLSIERQERDRKASLSPADRQAEIDATLARIFEKMKAMPKDAIAIAPSKPQATVSLVGPATSALTQNVRVWGGLTRFSDQLEFAKALSIPQILELANVPYSAGHSFRDALDLGQKGYLTVRIHGLDRKISFNGNNWSLKDDACGLGKGFGDGAMLLQLINKKLDGRGSVALICELATRRDMKLRMKKASANNSRILEAA